MSNETSTPHAKELDWLAKLELGRLNKELGKKPTLTKVTHSVEEHFKKVDSALIATDTQEQGVIECKKDCSYCCHTMVFANMGEIANAYIFIMKTFSKSEVHQLKEKLKGSVDGVLEAYSSGKPRAITCPMLNNGQCTVYKARPSQCRNAHSLNSDKCKEAYENPTNHEEIIPINPTRQEISRLMLSALASSLHMKKLDHNLFEFSTTLLAVMETPAILQKWVTGKSNPKSD